MYSSGGRVSQKPKFLKECIIVELRFLEPPQEMKIGSRNRELRNIGGKITVKTSP